MILLFTGTGNSAYIAGRIAQVTGQWVINMNEKIKARDYRRIECDEKLIIVVPTYAWRIPRIVDEWIRATEFAGAKSVWFVMNCGDQIGNAPKYNQKLADDKKLKYMGTAEIIMPENYIAMFNVPDHDEAVQIVENAEPAITDTAERIKEGLPFDKAPNNLLYRIMSSVINPIFYEMNVSAKKFKADERCTGCGKCVKLCPLNNIRIVDGKPVWGRECTHCMACICYCSQEAIEYGTKSVGKPRYHFDYK